MTGLAAVLAYLEEGHDRILAELIEFAAIPSVSTDPAHAADLHAAAAWVASKLAAAGPFTVRTIATPGASVVYAEWLGAPGAPTALIYGHYDVQPADPLELWHSPPFGPTVRDGRLYARGVSDDKGPMLIPIKVAEAFFAAQRRLPINVKFMIEGEEEIGSRHLEAFVAEHRELLEADMVISADGAMWRIDEPSLTVANRGLAGLELTVRGPAKDLHSGRHGGSVANPLHAMAQPHCLAAPAGRPGRRGRLLRPGARAECRRARRDRGAAIRRGDVSRAGRRRRGRRRARLHHARAAMDPAHAGSQRDVGRVPGPGREDGHPVRGARQDHLPSGAGPGSGRGRRAGGAAPGEPPAGRRADHDHARRSRRAALPHRPRQSRAQGGGGRARSDLRRAHRSSSAWAAPLPVAEIFQRLLGLDTVYFSFSTGDEDFHAPNEFFRVHRLHEGLAAWTRLWDSLGGPATS